MPKPGIPEVKTGGSASPFSETNLSCIGQEVADFLGLTNVRSACSACESIPQREAHKRRCPLFQPHNPEQKSGSLRHLLFNAFLSAVEPVDAPLLADNPGKPSEESVGGNSRPKHFSEARHDGDLRDRSRDDLLVITEVIKRTNLSRRKICYDMSSGALPYIKFGRSTRFAPHDVDAYIEARRINHRRTHK